MAIEWIPETVRTRDGQEQQVEIGRIRVPEVHGEASPEIELVFARIRAKTPSGAAPVVFLSGGPGDGAIHWATHGPFLKAFQTVAERCDVILLDQRGAGRSGRDLRIGAPTLGEDSLSSEAHMWDLAKRHIGGAAERLSAAGARLDGYTAAQSAQDLMALREALGVLKISLWGYSYGTHLSQITTAMFGEQLERVVLCGFEGPDQTFKFPANLDAQLHRLDRRYPRLLENLMAALRLLYAEPVRLEGGILFGGFALRHLVTHWCGISNRFGRLPAIAESLARGDGGELQRNLRDYLRLWERPLTFYLTDAASGGSYLRWKTIRGEEGHSLLGTAVNFPFPRIGSVIGAGDMGDELRRPLQSSLPFLVVTGSLDGFTPTSNAVEGMYFLPNARHVLIEGAAHNDLIGSPEVVGGIGEFFATGNPPSFDTATLDR